jgi:sulfate transport system ATP-binding protein
MALNVPAEAHGVDGRALIFVRPHLLDVLLEPEAGRSFPATVQRVNPAGPFVKVELVSEWGDPVYADLTQDEYRRLGLRTGARVFLAPREGGVFVERAAERVRT